jgi:hypothetical protein
VAGCRPGGESLRTLERVALHDSVTRDATLALDAGGTAWIGQPGTLAAYDSAGHRLTGFGVALPGAPRLLWNDGARLTLRTPAGAAVAESSGTRLGGTRRSAAPLARDPRGHWVFSATANGSVLGLDPATLAPRWGWPDAGSRVSALAVSPLGDRVYVALAGNADHDVAPAIQVRDAFSGRLLATWPSGLEVRVLEAAPNGTLFAAVGDEVMALRPVPDGLKKVWATGFGGFGRARPDALRVSPGGDRLAALARGRELRLLASADGRVLQESKEAPRDAAWDVSGRLWVLGAREIRIVR